jgi:hypothetical protein
MTTLILDPQHVARFTLDGDTTKSEAASKPATTYSNSSRRRLVCQWHRAPEGPLICTWGHVGASEAGASRRHINAESFASEMRRTNMNPRLPRALQIEAYAFSNVSGAIDAQLPDLSSGPALVPPAPPQSRAQAVAQWLAIALLLAAAGLETIMCFRAEPSGLL